MNIEKIKLVYSKKYNQYYKPIRFDDEDMLCNITVVKNKRDKSIHKDMIAKIEDYPEWKFIIMRNPHITAEDNFIRVMQRDGNYLPKLNELHEFKINGLTDSEVAMNELVRIFHLGFEDVKSREDRKFRQAARNLYIELCIGNATKEERKNSYNQRIPSNIKNLAEKKGIFIERNDEFCKARNGKRVKAGRKAQSSIRAIKPCGYLLRNKAGKVIAGGGYKLSDIQVIELVKEYLPEPNEVIGNYKVPFSKQEEKKFKYCKKIILKNKWRYKNANNTRFWILDKEGNVVYGGKDGVGLKGLFRYCKELKEKTNANI